MDKNKFIATWWKKKDDAWLARKLKTSVGAIENRRRRMRLKRDRIYAGVQHEGEIKVAPKHDRKVKRLREGHDLLKKKYDEALEDLEQLEAEIAAFKKLGLSRRTHDIKASEGTGSEAVAIAAFSDVHIGQEVKPGQVNDLNEYNIAIARQRCDRFFERVVRLTNKERQDITIKKLILFLGGDFIEAALHLDTIMASDLKGPMTQIVLAQEYIESGLRYLIAHGEFDEIVCVCADGNHGRVSVKQHHHSRRGNALEYYLYYNLAARFPQLTWVIEEGLLTYVNVFDAKIRFMHGDRIAFGGINGFYTYLQRRIYEWDASIRADYTILGHLHQYTPNRRYMVNGSVVGHNPFSIALNARFEPPIQGYMLWDKKRGPTVMMPILL